MRTRNRFLLPLMLSAFPATVPAENWMQWRGPHFNGATTEKNLPVEFTRTQSVVWTAPMPGPSGATPVVSDTHVFVASTDTATKSCVALALDRKTGQETWRVKVTDGVGQDGQSTYSNPSPVTDGTRAWFLFATGDLVCLDANGKEVWRHNIQKTHGQFAYQWTYGASPLLYDGRLYVQVLQRNQPVHGRGRDEGDSFLLALEPATGRELWKAVRPAQARAESLEAYSTPMPYTHNGRAELLITGGDCISGHDPATGKEFWRWGTWNPTRITHWRLVPSPVAGSGIALACGPKDSPVYAVKLGGKGELPNSALAWQSYVQNTEDSSTAGSSLDHREISSDVPTPLFYEGRFYILNGNKKRLISLDPATGKVYWSGDLKGKDLLQASPTAADGKIYVMNFAGEVFVVQAGGNEFKLLHVAAMAENDGKLRSSIPISRGQLFIRTTKNLYCVGR